MKTMVVRGDMDSLWMGNFISLFFKMRVTNHIFKKNKIRVLSYTYAFWSIKEEFDDAGVILSSGL